MFFGLVPGVVGAVVAIVAGFFQYAVGDVVFPRTIAVHNGLDQVFRHVVVVGQELLGVLGQAVAAIAEGRVIVLGADTRIVADAFDYSLGVKAFHLGISIQFVEVGHAKSQIGIGEEFDGLGLGGAHEQDGNVFLQGAFFDERSKGMGRLR